MGAPAGLDRLSCLCASSMESQWEAQVDGWCLEAQKLQCVHRRAVWATARQLQVFDALEFTCMCTWVWVYMFIDGCCALGVILTLLIRQACEGKLFNTVAESSETHTYTASSLKCVCSTPPLTSYRVTNHIPSVRPGWEAQFGLQSLAMTFQPQRKCSSINLQHRQVYGYIPCTLFKMYDKMWFPQMHLYLEDWFVCFFGVFCHFRLHVLEWKLIGNFLTVNPDDTKKCPKLCSSVRLCFKIDKTNYCFLTNSEARS